MKKQTRRRFLYGALPVTLGATFGFTELSASGKSTGAPPDKKPKVLVVGAHPDDPETICGGTMALFSNLEYEVVSAYLTRGEAGIEGKSYDESASIRTAEAQAACNILKVRAEFLGQIDGNCEITKVRYAEMIDFLKKEEPDIIFTHWPIDTHRDHRICSMLVYDAWLRLGRKASLYYCEAMSGMQSQNFKPDTYVDITKVIEQKHKACYAHASQQIEETYPDHHGKMEVFRGMENGCPYAEAFVKHAGNQIIEQKDLIHS
ncbi:MAG: PIG-L family deacetylase [Bacteroidales bacterium]|nr:PIG-L family deacetylase [Bacteroidales bacterium]